MIIHCARCNKLLTDSPSQLRSRLKTSKTGKLFCSMECSHAFLERRRGR